MNQPIKHIVILGGGTAGWITAGTIAAHLLKNADSGFSVTLIESANIPPIGVGEGTWPTMRRTLKKMGIRETDFIKQCNVSFKQGAKFVNWVEDNDEYYHPLMLPKHPEQIDIIQQSLHVNPQFTFADLVTPQGIICEQGLAPKNITTPEFDAIANYAYHLDAGKFSEFLKQHAITQLNVNHIVDDVTKVNSHLNADIASLVTRNNGNISGDLFIDCSGTHSILLGEHYQVPFISCKDVLFNDRAIAVQVPYDEINEPITSHTISTAQTCGWIWDIGLENRRGVGHVFASDYINDEDATEQLKRYLRPRVKDVDALTFRTIPFNPGHRHHFWHRNCVAVGLSAGFLEPLEASALLLVEISASMIAEQLPACREVMDITAKRFNETFLYRWQRIIDFLKLHYILSKRTDSQFWINHRNPDTIPESLQNLMTLWRYQPPSDDDFIHAVEVFPAASYQYILYGMGFYTQESHLGVSKQKQQQTIVGVENNKMLTHKMLSMLPSNRELINQIKQYGLQKI
ncbi:tryptophan halogenase family protein [Shewanella frigidimarina]|uniref:Tryptophan halogenase n=1 Tax=Shewanella frigidimarina TaxID=56812 RepID=A0A106BZ61_SHEFR|nr:tryptophan halogenase family protein [Shewanella frigidimarina]KVX01290.1 tryptophan halogenase [Shewanella frigidimarina]